MPSATKCPEVCRSNFRLKRLLAVLLVLSGVVPVVDARAYSSHNIVSDPCHEEITQTALERARSELAAIDMVGANDDERALIEDLPFSLQSNLKDLGAASLVLANHNVDYKGNEPNDLEAFAPLHGAPSSQREHCLRTPAQDGIEGSRAALAECRGLIRQSIEAALDGLASDGTVDPSARTELRVALDIRGTVDASLPTYHVEMGRALHTIQDGFSHTYRTADHLRVVTVLNYVDQVADTLDDTVDGPAHRSRLDACRGVDALRSERLAVVTDASTEFLVATLDPALGRPGKLARVDELLDQYFSHEEGCEAANDWCDAPEERYADSPSGCYVAGGPFSRGSYALLLSLVASGFILFRRMRRRLPRRHCERSGCIAVGLLLLLHSTPAPAQAEDNSAEPNHMTDPVASQAVAREDARIERDVAVPWGVALNLSGSVSNPAAAYALGARYRFDENWLVGLDVEHNPWYAESTSRFRLGVASAYASVMFRFPMRFERTNLRSTLQLGASRMLFDLYGVPEGTTGPFVGFNLLGIDYELGSQLYMIINPAHVVLPIPQTSGAPFSYTQYRITLGLQFGA